MREPTPAAVEVPAGVGSPTVGGMAHADDQGPVDDGAGEEATDRRAEEAAGDGEVSEGGSGALNPDTSLGGADSVPDTPDVNTRMSEKVESNEPDGQG